jgi:hypothetical protein
MTCLASSISSAATDKEATVGKPVFECYRINFAWGYINRGFYIDDNGGVFKYSNSEHSPSEDKDVKKLQDKYENKEIAGEVDKSVLTNMIKLVLPASKGKLIKRDSGVRDAGWEGCKAFMYDAHTQLYSIVELGTTGVSDMDTTNTASEASTLLMWLNEVGMKYMGKRPRR